MRTYRTAIGVILCWGLWLFQPACGQTLALGENPVHLFDQGELSVLRDPSREMSLAEVNAAEKQGQFRPLSANLGLGYVPEAVWLHLTLHQPAAQPAQRWLEILPPYLDDIQLFHIDPTGAVDHRRGGDRLPQSAKEEDYRATVFKLALVPGQHEFFLRLQTTSTLAAIVKLWQPQAFERHLRTSYFAYGLYYSLIFTVLIFNAASWLVSRRRIFLVYAGYLVLNMLQWLGINGFVAEFIFPSQPLLANLTLGLSLSLAATMAFVFYIMVLELRQYHPYIYRLNLAGIVISLATAVATPLGYYQAFAQWLMLIAVAALCTAPWPIRRLWSTGQLGARLLALAYACYSLLIGINILSVLAILPFDAWASYAGMTSNVFHILLLHFAILLHFRRIEKAHAAAVEESALAQCQAETEKRHREEQGKLLAMITHEIRTPVAVIDAATQTLRTLDEDGDNPIDRDREERYDRIRRSVNRLSVLLDLAIAQGKSEISDWQPAASLIEPVRLTREVVDLLGSSVAARVHLDIAPGLPALQGDERMLRFALLNLIDNACKYSPAHSPVRVQVTAESHAGCSGITWSVADSGPGVPAGMEEKIFDKYVRLGERSGKAGLGLGLYLVRHIIERHRGWVRAESGLETGACFICWIPQANHAEVAAT